MTIRDRIAFAMFRTDYPPEIAREMRLETLSSLKKLTFGTVSDAQIQEDWELNRSDFLRRADAALTEFDAYLQERGI